MKTRLQPKKETPIPYTKEGYEKLLTEKETLLAERPDAVEHLRLSREMGDLSENGYYRASRARLSFLDARIRRAEKLIRRAKIIESAGDGSVEIGSRTTVELDGKTIEYTITGSFESDPAKKTISHRSPVGRALMGKRKGDSGKIQTPSGIKSYTILDVSFS